MNLNTQKFFLTDVYSYDISACHYKILDTMGFDVSKLDKDNKEKRNIQIGKLMGENSTISSMLRQTTESLISEYIDKNGLDKQDIIVRQYDGFLTKKLLYETDDYLPLELKDIFTSMIISITKDKYIATTGKKIIVKGIGNYYKQLNTFYDKLFNINFLSKTDVFNNLKKIKEQFFEYEDVKLFCIPLNDEFNTIYFKQYGGIKTSKQVSKLLDHQEIDKQVYYDIYLKPFIQGIVIDFI